MNSLVSPQWLSRNLADATLRIVDASWYLPDAGRDPDAEFRLGHIAGATRFDPDAVSDHNSSLPHMLPTADAFAEWASGSGIGNDDFVIAYDGAGLFSAARLWWMFRVFGHDRVAVLDGGLPAWKAAGLPLIGGSPEIPSPKPAVARFNTFFRPELVRTLDQVRATLTDPESVVLDARGPARFSGEEPDPRPGIQPGHIPASRNLHYATLIDPDSGFMLPDEQVANRLAAIGVGAGTVMICSCGSGITACILALAIHRLGWPDGTVYDGSWSEWGARPDTPKAITVA